jgi:hypothetical protein
VPGAWLTAAEGAIERFRHLADRLGIKKPLKTIYRRMLRDAIGSPDISPRG